MFTFKFEDSYFTAYKANEFGNPHVKKYPCLVSLNTENIVENQRKIIIGYFQSKNLDYHEVIKYAEKDINTHDLVNALFKFHNLKKI